MRKFDYLTEEVKPEDFDTELTKAGILGWEFITLAILQRPKMVLGQQPFMDIKFLLIFKKEICQE